MALFEDCVLGGPTVTCAVALGFQTGEAGQKHRYIPSSPREFAIDGASVVCMSRHVAAELWLWTAMNLKLRGGQHPAACSSHGII
jgi:hypothetical protein